MIAQCSPPPSGPALFEWFGANPLRRLLDPVTQVPPQLKSITPKPHQTGGQSRDLAASAAISGFVQSFSNEHSICTARPHTRARGYLF